MPKRFFILPVASLLVIGVISAVFRLYSPKLQASENIYISVAQPDSALSQESSSTQSVAQANSPISPQPTPVLPSKPTLVSSPKPTSAPTSTPSNSGIAFSTVKQHNKSSDCWMVIGGKVYNVTSYVNSHPGGDAIVQGCGQDATQMFANEHSKKTYSLLSRYYVGDLKK